MNPAGSHAGPEQTEELISNTKCVGAPVATYYPDYASSRAGPGVAVGTPKPFKAMAPTAFKSFKATFPVNAKSVATWA
jgi:hypothetical protein